MHRKASKDMTAQLAHGRILPLVFRLAIPAVIAQLITFLYNIVDRMYVAQIDGSGMDALAALGIVLPITLILQSFANLIGLGGAPRAGERWRLSLGRVECTARVTINGHDAGIAWVEPKAIEFDGALFGESPTAEIEIEVANTITNRLRAAKPETLFDRRVLGPYHERQIVFEQEAAEGGLYGPVVLERLG